jgi:hypothetical protein
VPASSLVSPSGTPGRAEASSPTTTPAIPTLSATQGSPRGSYVAGAGEGDFSGNFGNNSSSSNADHSDSNANIPPPPSPPSVHTRLQKGIRHPK